MRDEGDAVADEFFVKSTAAAVVVLVEETTPLLAAPTASLARLDAALPLGSD